MKTDSTAILKGAFDFHVHTSPDVFDRKLDDYENALMARKCEMGGFIIKSHHSVTYGRAKLVSSLVDGINVMGGIALNNPQGGLNPQAVDIAGRMGAKIVWMPTLDSDNERKSIFRDDLKHVPYWGQIPIELAEKGLLGEAISIKDKNGKVKPELEQILDLISDYNMILSTGHLDPEDSIMLVKLARKKKIKNIVVSHPEFPSTKFTLEQQKELVPYDVFFERCYTTFMTGKSNWEHLLDEINVTGVQRNILSGDLGQVTSPDPVTGYLNFIQFFLDHGFTEDQLRVMTQYNQIHLLEG